MAHRHTQGCGGAMSCDGISFVPNKPSLKPPKALGAFEGLRGPPRTCEGLLPSRKLTWKPQKGPIKTTVLLKGGYMGFHVSLGV